MHDIDFRKGGGLLLFQSLDLACLKTFGRRRAWDAAQAKPAGSRIIWTSGDLPTSPLSVIFWYRIRAPRWVSWSEASALYASYGARICQLIAGGAAVSALRLKRARASKAMRFDSRLQLQAQSAAPASVDLRIDTNICTMPSVVQVTETFVLRY